MTTGNSGESRTFNVVVDGRSQLVTVTPSEVASAQPASSGDKSFQIEVDGRGFVVEVETGESPESPTLTAPPAKATPTPRPSTPAPAPKTVAAPVAPVTADGETVLAAPIPGTIVSYTVAEAQPVKAGETVIVLEAMKMENTLPSPVDGVIKQITLQAGAKVARGDVLLVIGPA